jgi:hypothetical protein
VLVPVELHAILAQWAIVSSLRITAYADVCLRARVWEGSCIRLFMELASACLADTNHRIFAIQGLNGRLLIGAQHRRMLLIADCHEHGCGRGSKVFYPPQDNPLRKKCLCYEWIVKRMYEHKLVQRKSLQMETLSSFAIVLCPLHVSVSVSSVSYFIV